MWDKASKLISFVQILILFNVVSFAQETTKIEPPESKVISIKPDYLSPEALIEFLGVSKIGNRGIMEWRSYDGRHMVEIRSNNPANLLVLSGEAADVDYVKKLIEEADIAPRQIEIEVKIIEVRKSKARDLGFDWDELWRSAGTRASYRYNFSRDDDRRFTRTETVSPVSTSVNTSRNESYRRRNDEDFSFQTNANLSRALQLLDESGAGTIRNAPRILTLNNRRASILDGERVTYITRYSSYTNLFETDSMDAGLNLSVTPSLGESGYITMNIIAELTSFERRFISSSPVKSGQMLENTVIVKDGESIFLGGLTRTIDEKSTKRFPILGHILPFLFSRETIIQEEIESIIILTPRVVDFSTALDDRTRSIMEGE